MIAASTNTPKSLIGASIPRSGHHYLHALLERYYSNELYYCELYNPPSCCKNIPCTRRGNYTVLYQKSHDREREVPLDLHDSLYIVQYRDPVPEALSDRELDLRDSLARRSKAYRLTANGYTWWLAAKAVYYRKFHDKWLAKRLPNAVYLDYDDLLRDPAAALSPIIEWSSGRVDGPRLDRAIEAGRSKRARTSQPFKPRIIERSPYFDRDLLAAFESFVGERCPAFGFDQRLGGSYRDHPIYGAILLLDEEEPLPGNLHDRLTYAALYAPDQPEIALRLAEQCVRAGEPGPAIEILKRAIIGNPLFAPCYRLLGKACAAAGRPIPPSLLTADAVLACADTPEILLPISAGFRDNDLLSGALLALSAATVITPEDPNAHRDLAFLLFKEGRFEQARYHAETALSLAPSDELAKDLSTRIRARIPDRRGRCPVAAGLDLSAIEELIAAAYKAVLGRSPNAKRLRASSNLFDGAPLAEGLERLLIALLNSKEFRDKQGSASPGGAKPGAAGADADAVGRPDA